MEDHVGVLWWGGGNQHQVKHARHKVAEGGNRGWDVLSWYENIERGYPSWRLMVQWWFMEARGEYATWTGVYSGIDGPPITVLELIEKKDELEPVDWVILLTYVSSRLLQQVLPRVSTWGKHGVGGFFSASLTWKWAMSTNWVQCMIT